jgi:hypothetical protein
MMEVLMRFIHVITYFRYIKPMDCQELTRSVYGSCVVDHGQASGLLIQCKLSVLLVLIIF